MIAAGCVSSSSDRTSSQRAIAWPCMPAVVAAASRSAVASLANPTTKTVRWSFTTADLPPSTGYGPPFDPLKARETTAAYFDARSSAERRAQAIDALTPASTAETAAVSSFTSPPSGGSYGARPTCWVRYRSLKHAEQVRAQAEAEDALLVERGVDEVRDLRVRLGELAPVQARALVVGGVEAVVEDEQVAELATTKLREWLCSDQGSACTCWM